MVYPRRLLYSVNIVKAGRKRKLAFRAAGGVRNRASRVGFSFLLAARHSPLPVTDIRLSLMVDKSLAIKNGDYIKRLGNGEHYKVSSDPDADATPDGSMGLSFKVLKIVKSALPE